MYHKFVSLKLIGVIFSQNYWLKVTKVLKKNPLCFQSGFLR